MIWLTARKTLKPRDIHHDLANRSRGSSQVWMFTRSRRVCGQQARKHGLETSTRVLKITTKRKNLKSLPETHDMGAEGIDLTDAVDMEMG